MGQYSEHWTTYTRESNRRTLRLLAVLLLLPVIAGAGFWLSTVTQWSTRITVALLIAWLALFTLMARASTRVQCPRCETVYSRGRSVVNCPTCGLRMFQEEPA